MYNDDEALLVIEYAQQGKAAETIQRAWRAHVIHEAEVAAAEETAQHAAEVAAAEAELRRLKEKHKELMQLRSSTLRGSLTHTRSLGRLGETSFKEDENKAVAAHETNVSDVSMSAITELDNIKETTTAITSSSLATSAALLAGHESQNVHSAAVTASALVSEAAPQLTRGSATDEVCDEELTRRKALLLEQYRALLAEREASVAENVQYQRMLAKYYNEQRQRKGEDVHDGDAQQLITTPELEEEYWHALREFGYEKEKLEQRREEQEEEFERRRQDVQPIIDHTTQQERDFLSYVASLAARATFIHSNNQHLPLDEVKTFLSEEQRIREEIRRARINLIVLKNKLAQLKTRMMSNKKAKKRSHFDDESKTLDHINGVDNSVNGNDENGSESTMAKGNKPEMKEVIKNNNGINSEQNKGAETTDDINKNEKDNENEEEDEEDDDDDEIEDGAGVDNGMFLIDFEQLKIESNNLHDKIEERDEDLGKLTRKVNTTLHVLSHVKEKLSYIKDENGVVEQDLQATESEVNAMRDQLAQLKRQRDYYNRLNKELRDKMPLIGSQDLLKDYEQRKSEIKRARELVVELTERHRVLMQEINKRRPIILSLEHELSEYPE